MSYTVVVEDGQIGFRKRCDGPVYFADQGIEVCETCGGCICCDAEHIDHSKAEYHCFVGGDGKCHLKAHAGRPCQ